MASCVDLTTPLDHETFKSSMPFENSTQRAALLSALTKISLSFLSFFSVLCVTMVAMPTGYKLVISRALGMHGIYCPQPSGTGPSGFGAINAIHPSCP